MDVRARAGSLVVIIASTVLVIACSAPPAAPGAPGPSATSEPVVTVSPTTTPSPTPVADVSKLFTAQMINPQFEGAGPISGTMTIGNLEGQVAGSMQVKGGDSTSEIVIEFPNVLKSSSATITVDGREYTSTDGGPWFQSEDPGTDKGLAGAIGVAALTARDAGIVTWQGQELHHIVPGNAGTITAADLGITDPSLASGTPTLDFYARDDGSLAGMSVALEWTVDSGGTQVPVAMSLDFAFEENPTVSITAPTIATSWPPTSDDVWVMYTSKQHGYSIGYPAGWHLIEAETAEGVDVFAYFGEYATGARDGLPKAAKDNLEAYVQAFRKATGVGFFIEATELDGPTQVGGEPAWRLAYQATLNGMERYSVFTLLIEGRNGYSFGAVGPKSHETDIVAFHELQLTTLEIPGR
jgi:hypothetical protein